MNWPLWGGLLAVLLLSKHTWVLFAPAEHAVPGTTLPTQAAQSEQLFGATKTASSATSLNGIRPIGIFASRSNGFAVMQTESGQVGVGVGGQVTPGVRLIETHSDYVILESNGVQQRVDLSKAPAASSAVNATHADTTSAADDRLRPQITPEQRVILQQEMKRGIH